MGIGVACSAVTLIGFEPWGGPLTVTRRFFDEGCTPGVAEESRERWGGDWGGCWESSLSSSLIRTAKGDWRVPSALWLARNAFGTKIGTEERKGDLRIDGRTVGARRGGEVFAGAFLCGAAWRGVGMARLDRWEGVADGGNLAEGRAAECLCKGGERLWNRHGERERLARQICACVTKKKENGTENRTSCQWG